MKKKFLAYSLLEVLVALIIISTAMVSSVAILVKPFRIVRENEIKSYIDSVTIRAFEFLKSKLDIPVQGDIALIGTDQNQYFSLREDPVTKKLFLKPEYTAITDDCISNDLNSYFYSTQNIEFGGSSKIKICLGINIVKDVEEIYTITVLTKYPNNEGEILTETIKTIRKSGFYEK